MDKDHKTSIVFISHAGSDSDLAMFIKTTLEEIIPGVEAFCSSCRETSTTHAQVYGAIGFIHAMRFSREAP